MVLKWRNYAKSKLYTALTAALRSLIVKSHTHDKQPTVIGGFVLSATLKYQMLSLMKSDYTNVGIKMKVTKLKVVDKC